MSEEVNSIISKQKLKKEETKASPPEMQCPGPDKNYGFDDDTITKVNRQIRDIAAMKKRVNETKTSRDSKCEDDIPPFTEQVISGGAATLAGIWKRAIRKSLEAVTGADLDSVSIMTARASPGKTAEVTVVYTLTVKLINVTALVRIITDALGKGRAKLFLEGIGEWLCC